MIEKILNQGIIEIVSVENQAKALPLSEAITTYRKNEFTITEYSKKLDADGLLYLKTRLENKQEQKDIRYACFALLFTYYRKNGKTDLMQNVIDAYANEFSEYYLCDFYKLMCYVKVSPIEKYDQILSSLENPIYEKYNGYIGYMNQYVELCARYYEIHLDRRKENSKEWCLGLRKAREFAESCCSGNHDFGSYAKLHANRGRIYALMGAYGDAETAISYAISLVSTSDPMYSVTISSFNNFYQNISSIAAYDISEAKLEQRANEITEQAKNEINLLRETNEKLLKEQQESAKKEMEKLKVENLRNVSVITAVFSLIISGIQAFANISDARTIGRIFCMYASLFFLAIGVIFLVTYLFTRDKKASKGLGVAIATIICIVAIVAFVLCSILP